VSKETEMAKFKDDEIQDQTPNPRSPADQRRDSEDQLAEYLETHEKAGKENRGE
jgi:hypothetical protein